MTKGAKIKKPLKDSKKEIKLKLTDQTKPKFAHNARAANKKVFWTYSFWKSEDPGNVGEVVLEMDTDKFSKMDENRQSKEMNDAAIAFVQKEYKDFSVKLTSV